MRAWMMALTATALLAGCLAAPEGEALSAWLVAHRVYYDQAPDGQAEPPLDERDSQDWRADGSTTYHGWGLLGSDRTGMWRIADGAYCSAFPLPGDAPVWSCYHLRFSDEGRRVRFDPVRGGLFERDWRGTAVPAG